MPETDRRTNAPSILALLLNAIPFLTASAMLALAYGLRWNGLLLSFVHWTGPFMMLLIFLGSGALLFAAASARRLANWRIVLSALFLLASIINFALFSMKS